MVTGVVLLPVEICRDLGGPDKHATTENFGTKNNADVRTESTDFSNFLHDSIV
jgi:hypothetical protein